MNAEKLRKITDCLCQQIDDCRECKENFNMSRHPMCCLYACHEYEFCRGCDDCGIYHEDFKDFIKRWSDEDSNSRSMEF